MGDKTGIQWTDATWNPTTGCSMVDADCSRCYAKREWARLSKNSTSVYFLREFEDVAMHPARLDQPLRWKRPRRIFVDSMSDLFHEDIREDFIAQVFDVMEKASWYTFQVLTKRPERMRDFFSSHTAPSSNVIVGTSCAHQEAADKRVPPLVETFALRRFLSVEPLHAPVNLFQWIGPFGPPGSLQQPAMIDWVIVGGESGPRARPCNIEWIRSIVAQCRAAKVPVFVKQLGAWAYDDGPNFAGGGCTEDGTPVTVHYRLHTSDRKGGDIDEWPEDLRIREMPA